MKKLKFKHVSDNNDYSLLSLPLDVRKLIWSRIVCSATTIINLMCVSKTIFNESILNCDLSKVSKQMLTHAIKTGTSVTYNVTHILGNLKTTQLLFTNPTINLSEIIEENDYPSRPYSAFLKACANGLVDIVKFIIDQHYSSFAADHEFALSVACEHKRLGVIKLLLKSNFPIGTALQSAMSSKNVEVIQLLLEDPRVTISPEDICYALIDVGDLTTTKLLLSDPRFVPQIPSMLENPKPLTFYELTGEYREWIEIVKMLLNDPTADPSINNNKALDIACWIGSEDILKLILSHPNVDPNIALSYLIFLNSHLLEILIEDPRIDEQQLKELFLFAGRERNVEALEILVGDSRIDPSHNDYEIIDEILENEGGMEEIEVLLEKVDCCIIFDKACKHHAADCLKDLIKDYNVNPSINDNAALKQLFQDESLECVQVLLQDSRVDPKVALDSIENFDVNERTQQLLKVIIKDPRINDSKLITAHKIAVANKDEKGFFVRLIDAYKK